MGKSCPMKGGANYQLPRLRRARFYAWKEGGIDFCGLSRQHTHQRLHRQQRRRVVAQVGSGIHDGVDLFDC